MTITEWTRAHWVDRNHPLALGDRMAILSKRLFQTNPVANPVSIILAGSSSLGKSTIALQMIRRRFCELNAQEPITELCPSCRQLYNGTHADVILLGCDAQEQTLSAEDLKKTKEQLSYSSWSGQGKSVLLIEAHRMSITSANSVLKEIEEPNTGVQWIMTTQFPERLPSTIRSRLPIIRVTKLRNDQLQQWYATRWGTPIDPQWLPIANGRPGILAQLQDDPGSESTQHLHFIQAILHSTTEKEQRVHFWKFFDTLPTTKEDRPEALQTTLENWSSLLSHQLVDGTPSARHERALMILRSVELARTALRKHYSLDSIVHFLCAYATTPRHPSSA